MEDVAEGAREPHGAGGQGVRGRRTGVLSSNNTAAGGEGGGGSPVDGPGGWGVRGGLAPMDPM